MDPNFDRSVFPKFEAPWVEDLPYILETCRGGPRPIRLCLEKTKNFGQIQLPWTWRPKWTQILIIRIFPKFEAHWVEELPYMLETCRGGPRPIRLCVEKTKNFGQIQPPRTWRPKFDRPFFPKFEAPWVEDLPYMLETCREGPRPIRLCVEKTKNFGQIQPMWTWRPKWTQILIGPFSPNLKPLE